MAAETAKIINGIVELATAKPKPKYTEARNKFDAALLAIEKGGGDKEKFLDDLNSKLKDANKNISLILKGSFVTTHDLIYDAFGEAMEPIYYWILDFLTEMLSYKVEKTSDIFAASEASGYYGEMGQRRTAMESRLAGDRGLFGTINLVVKSIINLLFDLKTFDIRLTHYDDLKSKDPVIKKSAVEALKGTWLNEVDKAKGNAAIDTLATQLNFITLRDAFMIVPVQNWYMPDADSKKISEIKDKVVKNVNEMDLTEVVKRILAPRIKEFVDWIYLSEKELRKRRDIEKAYLKAQNAALKAYTGWARPYLIGAQKLIPAEYKELQEEHRELGLGPEATPTSFHALSFYIELLAKKEVSIELSKVPIGVYKKLELKDDNNTPLSVIDIKFAFRGTPQSAVGARGEREMAYTGKTFIRFSGYVMQKKHWDLLKKQQDDEVLKFIDVMTEETLKAMADDLKKYLEEPKEEKKIPSRAGLKIPFSAFIKPIFGSMKKFNEQTRDVFKKMPKLNLSSDEAWKIARLRLVAEEKANKDTKTIFEKYRKAHKMITPP